MSPIPRAESVNQLNELTREGVVLVDYGAPWCQPCRTLEPILRELGEELAGSARIVYVDCDALPDAAAAAGVMGTPTVVVYKDGQPMEKLVGLRSKAAYRLAAEKHL
ncbi:thioredoxin family protein [Paenibacillus sp. GCM10023250]|uniref:thioredoxin family protein n=1 Tax=Paenibacillus sp. GCM10023250 TaxID=3252648 RepID=UPI003610019F